jgi:copper transport protein
MCAAPAQAHAFLVGSNPADGALLTTAPRQLHLQFSESVVLGATRVEIVAADGALTEPSALRMAAEGDDPEQPVELIADVPALTHGAYRVSWQTLSSDDLHRTSGVFAFGIGQSVTATGVEEPWPRAEEAALRWAMFIGFGLASGGALAARLYRKSAGLPSLAVACERLALAGAMWAVGISVVLLADQSQSSGVSLRQLLSSGYGGRWAIRELGLGLLAVGAVIALRTPSGRLRAALTTSGAVVAAVGSAQLAHASAGSPEPTRMLAEAAHLIATGCWSGALITLIVFGYRRLREHGTDGQAVRAALRAFAVPAAACVATAFVTGVYLVSGTVGSVDAALLTFYGRSLLIKIGLFAAAGILGLLNHRRVRNAQQSIGRTVLAEAVLLTLALGLAAVLSSSQPAREPQFIRPAQPHTVPVLDIAAADLQETLAVTPNRLGEAVLFVEVLDTRRPAPARIASVSVTLTSSTGEPTAAIEAQRLTDGRWSAPVTLSAAGRNWVDVVVRRPGLADTPSRFGWIVGGGATAPGRAIVSKAPWSSALSWLAAILAVIAILLGLFVCGWRRFKIDRGHRLGAGRSPMPEGSPERLANTASKTGVG